LYKPTLPKHAEERRHDMIKRILLAALCLILLNTQTRLFNIVQYETRLPLTEDMNAQIQNAGRGVFSSAISVRKGTAWLRYSENSAEAAWYLCTGSMMEQNGYRLTAGHWPVAGLGDQKHIAVHMDIAQVFIADPELLIGQEIELNGAPHTVVGLFRHANGPLTQLERAGCATPYEGEAETGVIEYRFRAGEAALYREFIANTIGATAVNDIDTMARTNVCLLALCILFCTISPAKTAYRRLKTKWYELASDVRTQMKTDYWLETAKIHAKDALLLTMISAAAAVPFAAVYIWLSHFFYIPLGLLPDNLRSLTLIIDTVREYAIAQNNDPGAATAFLAHVRLVRIAALILAGLSLNTNIKE